MILMRSIDAPTLPAWAEEMTDGGKKNMDTTEDPAALAKRLAAEAKAKLAKKKEAPEEDPAAMAKRLAAEAKARLAKPTAPKKRSLADRAINPKALASKLAAEKKADLEAKRQQNLEKLSAKTGSADADAVTTLDVPVQPKTPDVPAAAAAPAAKKKKKKKAAPKKSLRDRAQKTKKLSAAEALAAALTFEKSAPPKKASKAKAAPAPTPDATAVETASPVSSTDPAEVIQALLPDAGVGEPILVTNPAVFQALWKAHRARAVHDNDLNRVATASVLLEAIGRLPAQQMAAAKVSVSGEDWAVWVDLSRNVLLGAAQPADVFLAGL
jgi:colicin import membrane protein